MKKKLNERKVFEGILFDVYHWEQEQFDGSFKTFERVVRLGSTSVIGVVKDKIILIKESQPSLGEYTSVPGGMVDRGTTPEENAKKELLEETGYDCKTLELFFYRERITDKIIQPLSIFIAKNLEKVAEQNLDEGGEKIEVMLLSFEEFLEEIEKPDFKNPILRNIIYRMRHTEGELEKFKRKLFD